MSNPTNGTLIVGITAAVVAVITALGQRLAARAANTGPASVADGYGQLVADLRSDLDRTRTDLRAVQVELAECNDRHHRSDHRIAELEREIGDMHEWAKGHALGQIKSRTDDHPGETP